jgi:hypothetical protein
MRVLCEQLQCQLPVMAGWNSLVERACATKVPCCMLYQCVWRECDCVHVGGDAGRLARRIGRKPNLVQHSPVC